MKRLAGYIENPNDAEANWNLAQEYESIGQLASAFSFYLRCAELTRTKLLAYECLIKCGDIFRKQGIRNISAMGMMDNAIALLPRRPEAYLLKALMWEENPIWSNEHMRGSYMTSTLCLEFCDFDNLEPLRTQVGFPGKYAVLFQQAHTAWHVGLCDESAMLFQNLWMNYEMDEFYTNLTRNNLINTGSYPPEPQLTQYNKTYNLRHQFSGFETIEKNYSEAFQDIFVLSMLNGKRDGFYIEIGSARPFYGNNTALLEEFGWQGIGVDLSELFVRDYNRSRTNKSIVRDATSINYHTFLKASNYPEEIDYLQIDVDPPGVSLQVLRSIPFEQYKFRVITFEHDYYTGAHSVRQESRKLLESYGYKLVAGNISPDSNRPYEDWWVHPDLVETSIIDKMLDDKSECLSASAYIQKTKTIEKKEPWQLSIAPTMEFTTTIPQKGCVVDCVFCPQRTLNGVYDGDRILHLDDFKRIVDKIPQPVRISFAGFTEPWLNKRCSDMILYAHEAGHPISVFTTGVGMTEADVEKIKDIPYAGNPNGGFVLHLPDLEEKAKHPINDRYVKVVELLRDSNIRNFKTMCMGTIHPSVAHLFPQVPIYEMYSRANNLLGEAKLKPELNKYSFKTTDHGKAVTCGCDERMYHNVCLPDGRVVLCCMDYNLDHVLGNLLTDDYLDCIPKPYECFALCQFCENGIDPTHPFIEEERRGYGV